MNVPVDQQPALAGNPTAVDPTMLREALNAMRSLLSMFAVERYVYVFSALASSGLFFFATYKIISEQDFSSYMGLIFGASGLATVSSSGSIYFFKRAFNLIQRIILRLAGIEP